MTIQLIDIVEPEAYVDVATPKDCTIPRLIREVVGEPYPTVFEVVLVSGQKIYVQYKKFRWVEVTTW